MGDLSLTLTSGATLSCDNLFVCAGRQSNTAALDLAAAGITPGKYGVIPVNGHYQSTTPHIYAAGDVAGPPALASAGIEQARVAFAHAPWRPRPPKTLAADDTRSIFGR